MEVLKVNEDVLELYIKAMEDWCKERGFSFRLNINKSFHENWSAPIGANDGDVDAEILDAYYEFDSAWMNVNKVNYDDLVYAFLKCEKYKEFVNDDT